jgi:hypothetical protein
VEITSRLFRLPVRIAGRNEGGDGKYDGRGRQHVVTR